MDIISSLQWLGLHGKQAEIFLSLYKFGAKPASSIAKMIGAERTNTYKALQSMVRSGYVAETSKAWVKHFFVADKNILRSKIEQEQREINEKQKWLPKLETELAKLDDQCISSMPQMRFFEGKSGITNLFDDMYNTINQNKYLVIKMFASNTLESQSTSQQSLRDYAKWFLDKIDSIWVRIEAYLGNGIMMLESLIKTFESKELTTLPAGNAAINLFIVWSVVYLLIYKQTPFGLKIESEELADVFHFLLKMAVK